MAFQPVVDNQDLTSIKAGFYHIETVLSDLPGPPPGAAQDGLSSPPRVGAVSLSPSASQLNISARDHGRMPALTRPQKITFREMPASGVRHSQIQTICLKA
jgi:hypothetical protein